MTSRTGKWIVAGIALVMIGASAGLIWSATAYWKTLEPSTDVAQYPALLKQFANDSKESGIGLVDFFPPQIPAEATNPRLSYQHGQSATRLEIRYQLPSAELNGIAVQMAAMAKKSDRVEADVFSFRNEENTAFAPLPVDFVVYVVKSGFRPANPAEPFLAGTAISQQRAEIIYWAMDDQ